MQSLSLSLALIVSTALAPLAPAQVTYASDGRPLVESYVLDVVSGVSTGPVWTGVEVWGLADDASTSTYYMSAGAALLTHPFSISGLPAMSLGIVTDPVTQNPVPITGLAFNNGVLYGNGVAAVEGLHSIDLVTLTVTLEHQYTSSAIAVDGIDFDPATGLLLGANDGAAYIDPAGTSGRGLVTIDLASGLETTMAPYPGGENDLDGLAFDPVGGFVYFIEDEPAPLHRLQLSTLTYDPLPPMNGFTSVGVYSGGTYSGQAPPTSIGTSYCTAAVNSTGMTGAMGAQGSLDVATNDVTLIAESLPPNQFGIFVTSQMQGFSPGAGGSSNGNICVSGAIGRFANPNQILGTGSMGTFSLMIDLTGLPQGNGTVAALSGQTWNFQAWHRDGVGLGSNFTNGLQIDFN